MFDWLSSRKKKVDEYEPYDYQEICSKDYGKHEKGDAMALSYRVSRITGEVEALYHCSKCFYVMHYPLSKNPAEKQLHDKILKNA